MTSKTNLSRGFKFAGLLPLAALLMGNESCQKQVEAPKARELKKIVEMGRMSSPLMVIPGVTNFDFGFVANQQLYGVLMESDGFALRYLPPLSSSTIDSAVSSNLSQNDVAIFRKARLSGGSVNQAANWSKEASCMVNLPMAKVSGSVNAFEIVGGGGLTIGFTPSGAHNGGGLSGDLGVQLQYAQMDLSMMAIRSLTNGTMAAVNVTAKQTKTNINVGINLGMFRLGPSFFYQTPLASVTKNALIKAVTGLKENLAKEEWYTRVLANHDSHLTIIGGRNVNLEKGDQLAVYNELYYWHGEPCGSQYIGGAAQDPVAIAEVESVGDEISIVKLIKQSDENAVIGAKVTAYKLIEKPKTGTNTDDLTDVGPKN
ncbi:MAG TPA: hypothetical protein PL182_01115 [Pseudobdellovibrionaceae bacterium]|nr:hypothetical protein [Pseudobdellovibrionaceae bacterium]